MNIKTWHHQRYDNPHTNPQIGLSICCNARPQIIPACFGDPELILCSNCNEFCEIVWQPIFEKVSKGTYRKIVYPINELQTF